MTKFKYNKIKRVAKNWPYSLSDGGFSRRNMQLENFMSCLFWTCFVNDILAAKNEILFTPIWFMTLIFSKKRVSAAIFYIRKIVSCRKFIFLFKFYINKKKLFSAENYYTRTLLFHFRPFCFFFFAFLIHPESRKFFLPYV